MLDNQRHLDEQMANISAKAGGLPERPVEQFNITSIQTPSGDTAIVLNLRDEDLHEEDIPVARLFVNERFAKKLSTGTWHGGGDKFTTSTEFGKILERSLVNQARSNEQIKSLLIDKGYSFEEPTV